jgi:hypothetical protein
VTVSMPRRCQYLYVCTSKASKLSSKLNTEPQDACEQSVTARYVSEFALLY